MKKLFLALFISLVFFLPQNSYALLDEVVVDGFDFPVGVPDGVGYEVNGLVWLGRYDYEGDEVLEYHPGEDWNDNNTGLDYGGNSNDAGDPVYAIGHGVIRYSSTGGPGWGDIVLIEHNINEGEKIWSQYAHLDTIKNGLRPGVIVKRGDIIGSVGDYPDRKYKNYHLHFEIRKKYRPATAFVMDWSKEQVEEYYVNPSEFINANRPQSQQGLEAINLTNSPESKEANHKIGGGKVIWNSNEDEQDTFPHNSTLYYHDLETGDNGKIKIGNSLNKIEGPNYTVINDDYFCYAGKSSINSVSDIFCHNLETGIDMKITGSTHNHSRPALSESNYLVWMNVTEDQLYYTNISGPPQIEKVFPSYGYQYQPNIWGSKVVFTEKYQNYSYVYLSDLETGETEVISIKTSGPPDIWGDWISWAEIGGSVKLYNYVTGEERLVTKNNLGTPSLSHGKLAWAELAVDDAFYIHVFDIEKSEDTKLDMRMWWGPTPYIYDNYVSFLATTDPMSTNNDSMDVWLVKL